MKKAPVATLHVEEGIVGFILVCPALLVIGIRSPSQEVD